MNSVSQTSSITKSVTRTTLAQPLAPDYALTWLDAILALLLSGASLVLYVRTLAPFVLGSDSGEFQVLAYQLGIAHTPGYPVYLVAGDVVTAEIGALGQIRNTVACLKTPTGSP